MLQIISLIIFNKNKFNELIVHNHLEYIEILVKYIKNLNIAQNFTKKYKNSKNRFNFESSDKFENRDNQVYITVMCTL